VGKTIEQAERFFHRDHASTRHALLKMGPIGFCFYAQSAINYLQSRHAHRDPEMLVAFVHALKFQLESNPDHLRPIAGRLDDFLSYVNRFWEKFYTWENDDDQDTGILVATLHDRLRMISDQAHSSACMAT
jgi:hypothetical protein